jgi:hypothetical protein
MDPCHRRGLPPPSAPAHAQDSPVIATDGETHSPRRYHLICAAADSLITVLEPRRATVLGPRWRSRMFSRTLRAGTSTNASKTKPILVRPAWSARSRTALQVRSGQLGRTSGRPVQARRAMQQRALARPRRTHHCRERTAAEIDVDEVEGHRPTAAAVNLRTAQRHRGARDRLQYHWVHGLVLSGQWGWQAGWAGAGCGLTAVGSSGRSARARHDLPLRGALFARNAG